MIRRWSAPLVLTLGFALACSGAAQNTAPPASSSGQTAGAQAAPSGVTEPTRVLPNLRTGTLEPISLSAIVEGEVVGYARGKSTETFSVIVPYDNLVDANLPWIAPDPSDPNALYSFIDVGGIVGGNPGHQLWIRRKLDPKRQDFVEVNVLTLSGERRPATERRVRVSLAKLPKSNAKVEEAYLSALARNTEGTPFAALLTKYRESNAYSYYADWSSLMRMATGYDSVQTALFADRKLRATADPKKATVPLDKLTPPNLPSHQWDKMIAALPKAALPAEPLARVTPNDFYFIRASGFAELQRVLDEADAWVVPGLRLAHEGGRRLDLVDRYRAQLGLSKSELVRLFGPKSIRDLALVGSDPFLRQGSDVSLLIRPLDAQALGNLLNSKLVTDYPGGVKRETFEHRGVSVQHNTSADGALRQYVAQLPAVSELGPVTVVSNSKGAVQRIIEVAQGASGALSTERDFQYMLARDSAIPSDVLAYGGDAFVRRAVAPAQRVLDARRQLGLAELNRLGYGALLFGWLEGREPASVDELLESSWFDSGALRHTTGEPIAFGIGSAPRSAYGTPSFLEPIIDTPVPAKVTEEEQQAYVSFANSYAFAWSDNVDPIAMRVQVAHEEGKVRLRGHIRVLPALNNMEYSRVRSLTGDGQVKTRPTLPGFHATFAIGKDSDLRRELSGQGRSFLGRDFNVDWLGEWITVGVADEPAIPNAMQELGEAPELPNPEAERTDELDALRQLPLYLAIDLKRASAAAIALTVLRKLAEDSVPDVEWSAVERHGEASIVRVHIDDLTLYYALTKSRLLASMDLPMLRSLIDQDVATTPVPGSDGGQLSLDLAPRDPSGLLRALGWLIESELRETLDRSFQDAEVLLRGAPTRTPEQLRDLAFAYQGSVPVTPDGALFRMDRYGITDPARGSHYRPIYDDVPAQGSPLATLLAALGRVNVQLAFDPEPAAPDQFSLRSSWVVERDE